MKVSLQGSRVEQVLFPQRNVSCNKPRVCLYTCLINLYFNYVAIQVAQKLPTAVVRVTCPEIHKHVLQLKFCCCSHYKKKNSILL